MITSPDLINPDPISRFLDAQRAFDATVQSIGPDQWDAPTPCSDWNTRDLVNHLVYEQRWATPMLAGATVEEVGDRFDGDLLGEDPTGAWASAAQESAAAVSAPGVLGRTVNTSMGSSPATQYLSEMTCDLIVHRWDLGQAIDREQRFTGDELAQVEALVEAIAPMQTELEAAGVFGAPVEAPPDADAQSRALAALGRQSGQQS